MTATRDSHVDAVPQVRPAHRARRDVQGLRALAVLIVIADHLFGWPSGGFVGVDVFFVISGYLITGLLLREHARTGSISFRRFYARRVKRILPNAVLVLWFTATASALLVGGSRLTAVLKDCVYAAFFSANIRFTRTGTDYFSQGLAPSPVQHFWSLAVEEQFYFVWPWVMLGLLALGTKRLHWGERQHRRAVGVAMAIIVVLSFAWAMVQTARNPTAAYFSTAARAWELGLGALVAVAGGAMASSSPARRTTLGWLGLAGILTSLFVIDSSTTFPAPWAALPVVSATLVILAGHDAEQKALWPLTNRVSTYIGDVSYSLYLWHWPLVVLSLTVLSDAGPAYYAVVLALTGLLSLTTYHFVEDPIRRSGWLTSRGTTPSWADPARGAVPRTLVAAVVVLALVSGGLVLYAVRFPSAANLQPVNGLVAAPRCFGAAALDPGADCAHADLGNLVRPAPAHVAEDVADAYACYAIASSTPRMCSYGSTQPSAVRIALVGDSHAGMLMPALKSQLLARNWRLDVYIGRGCQLRVDTSAECRSAMDEIRQRLVAGHPYAYVLATASRAKNGPDEQKAVQDYASVWRAVTAAGTPVIAVADAPEVSREAMNCVARVTFDVNHNSCGTSRAKALAQGDALLGAAALVPGVTVVDLTSFYCTTSFCPAVIGHALVYRDTAAHITATYSATLGPSLGSALSRAMGQAPPAG